MSESDRKISGYKNGKPDVAYWLEQIRWAHEWRKKWAYEAKWETWNKYYRGEWLPNILPNNLFFQMIRTMVPRIYFRNPSVSVISTRPGIENYVLCQLIESLDNQLIWQMKLKREMKRVTQSTWMRGTGITKLGFGAQFAMQPNIGGETRQPIVRNKELVEYDKTIIPNFPWVRNVHTKDYLVPWGCVRKEDARWDCFIINRPTEDVKKDPRFKTPKDLQGNSSMSMDPGSSLTLKAGYGRGETIDLYEIRDRKTNKVFVITASHDQALVDEDDIYGALGIDPAGITQFNDTDDSFWALPDSQILEPLQLEMNDTHTYAMYHRRLSLIKLLAKRGAVDKDEIAKILNGDILSVVWTNDDIQQSVQTMQSAFIPPDLFQQAMSLEGLVRNVMGMSRNQSGEFKQGSRSPTATEVQEVAEANNIRVDERRDMLADNLVDLISNINPIVFRIWNQEMVQRVVGPFGVPLWVKFQPSMLTKGHFMFRVDPDSSVPETKDLRQAKALKLYEVLKTNPLISPQELTRFLLHEMNGVQFDEMFRGVPAGIGFSQQQPMQMDQLMGVMQRMGQQGLLPPPGANAQNQRAAGVSEEE